MKKVLLFLVIVSSITVAKAQPTSSNAPSKKGQFYGYWGWNRAAYSRSNIHFTGTNYDFTLDKVEARDRQSEFKVSTYLNPANMTIPQTNVRFGYFLKDNLEVSVGVDHMKYVMVQNQPVNINGYIVGTETTYDGTYNNQEIILADSFLTFEHTDGLNYINFEVNKHKYLYTINTGKRSPIYINALGGGGIGALLPKSNTKLFGGERYDEFHLAGYGCSIKAGLNIAFGHFFIQSEWKGGFINLPDIRTTNNKADRASQNFVYSQANITFGFLIKPRGSN